MAQTILVNKLDVYCFGAQERPQATSALTNYYVPSSRRNAACDAFFHHEGRGVGLQMTLSETHSLNAEGLNDLYNRLQYPGGHTTQHWYVVVIRKGCQLKKFESRPNDAQLAKFRFFTMELELPTGMRPFLP